MKKMMKIFLIIDLRAPQSTSALEMQIFRQEDLPEMQRNKGKGNP